jgi:hypothetical protein
VSFYRETRKPLFANPSRYDYDSHCCVFNSNPYYCFEDAYSSPIWQRLETILTAWIEMIERRKVAVVHRDLGGGPDPASGVCLDEKEPWGWASWTKADLEDALEAWNDLISAINDRLPEPYSEPLTHTSLFEVEDLRAAAVEEGSFAWEFYSKACRPHFQFLGPGLQIVSREQLLAAPFKRAWEEQKPQGGLHSPELFPLPILLGSQLAKCWADCYQYEVGSVSWGLYLDMLHVRTLTCPYDDAARLVLPYEFDGTTSARTLDGRPATGNADLYQIGTNPFEIHRATTQLWQMLKNFTAHVDAKEWKVDANGVNECYESASVFDNFVVHGMDPDGDEADDVRYGILKNMYL